MIAHEVRGPVTTIRGIASTAASHYERLGDEERREFFGLIEQESRRLLGAVDQTSTALKVDAGTLTFTMAPTDLAATVRAGVEAADVGDHPVHVVAQEEVVVHGDPSRLSELVVQLLTNAAKFSPPEAPITVRAVADDGFATIEIDDRGPGIPQEHREAVFGRFARWRPAGYEEQPGNGLGLFISRGLAAEHQGEIIRRGRTGRGYDAPGSASAGRDLVAASDQKVTLLICDDHKILTDALATVVGPRPDPGHGGTAGARPRDGDRGVHGAAARRRADGHRVQGRHERHRGDPHDQGGLALDEGRDHDRARRGPPAGGSRRGRSFRVPGQGRGRGGAALRRQGGRRRRGARSTRQP